MSEARGKLRIPLVFSKFREDLCAASFWAFFLGNSIVSTSQTGRDAVFARIGAFADTFDLASVTAGGRIISIDFLGDIEGQGDMAYLSHALLTGVEPEEVDMIEERRKKES